MGFRDRGPHSDAALEAASPERLREIVKTMRAQLAERDEVITELSAERDALEVLVSGLDKVGKAVDDVLAIEYARRGYRYTPASREAPPVAALESGG